MITFYWKKFLIIFSYILNRMSTEFKRYMCECAQLCLTLCDPMDCNPPGCSVHGISHARILGWVAIFPPGDLRNPGIELHHPMWQIDSSPLEPPRKPLKGTEDGKKKWWNDSCYLFPPAFLFPSLETNTVVAVLIFIFRYVYECV